MWAVEESNELIWGLLGLERSFSVACGEGSEIVMGKESPYCGDGSKISCCEFANII